MECWKWPPPRRGKTINLIVASSILTVEETLELKTLKVGVIARLAGIYRVDAVTVYRDKWSTPRDHGLMKTILEYAATPPHLRRRLIPLKPELKAAGYLPPLRLPGHDLPRKPYKGLVMEGIVESCTHESCLVYLGSYGVGRLHPGNYRVGGRVTVEVVDPEGLTLREARDRDLYLGFRVEDAGRLDRYLARLKGEGFTIIGASRRGECLSLGILEKLYAAKGVALVFGGPRGEVTEDADPSLYDAVINTIPLQGSRTVRTEEAVAATLAVLNAFEGIKRLYNP